MSLLEVKNIKKYYKDVKAVDDISFTIEKGEIFGFLGPNGAGKSTTISMISTLLTPDEGEILYKGTNILKNPKVIQKYLGIVPQEIALYPTMSAIDNLNFWGKAYGLRGKDLKTRVVETLEAIGLTDRAKDKVKTYSGGMKRRLNIGAALIHKPEIIIMDEPTVGIDPQSRNHILDTVKELNKQGMTVIYTSHYMEEVEYLCERVCIMDMGKIIAEGNHGELVKLLPDSVVINVDFEKTTDSLIDKLNALDKNKDIHVAENTVCITTMNKNNMMKRILDISMQEGIAVHSIESTQPNLEAVFLHLTGKALRD